MVQLWLEPDPEQEAVTLVEEGSVPRGWKHVFDGVDGRDPPVSLVHEDTEPLRRMAVFDIVVNNADRKGGHVLEMADGHRYGVDHGVSFHVEHKLRTVLWGWLGDPCPEDDLDAVLASAGARRAARRRARPPPHRPGDRRRGHALPPAVRARRDARAARVLPRDPVAAVLTGSGREARAHSVGAVRSSSSAAERPKPRRACRDLPQPMLGSTPCPLGFSHACVVGPRGARAPGDGTPGGALRHRDGQPVTTAPEGPARLYVCGITPYDATHMGHAATYVGFDLLNRAWRNAGHEVIYVRTSPTSTTRCWSGPPR